MSTKKQVIELLTAEINWQTFLLKNLADVPETEQKITAKIERLTKLLTDVENTDFIYNDPREKLSDPLLYNW